MQFFLCLVFTSCILNEVFGKYCYPGACGPNQTCCETVFDGMILCCPMQDAVCCYGQILCCPKGFVCGRTIGSCHRKPMRQYLVDINKLEKRQGLPAELRYLDNTNELQKRQGLPAESRYLDNINELDKRQGLPDEERYLNDINELKWQGLPAEDMHLDDINGLEKRQGLPDEERYLNDINELKWQGVPAEERYLDDINELKGTGLSAEDVHLDDINELEKRQGLPSEDVHLDDINELEKRQGLPDEERPFLRSRCDDRTFCPPDRTCCLSLAGTYGCCPHLHATCCPDKIHCCPHNQKCDATSRYCLGEGSTFPSKAQGPAIVIDEESLI